MTGIRQRIEIDDLEAAERLRAMQAAGEDLLPAMDDIGSMLVANILNRFETETGPGGIPWQQSIRAREQGGQTLTDSARLRTSFTHRPAPTSVEAGTNVVYAAIHQKGGTIRPKTANHLVFKIGDRFVSTDKVEIPPRPIVGFDNQDRAGIRDIVGDHIMAGGA